MEIQDSVEGRSSPEDKEGMERGLLWLPLLGVFFALTWAGWHEYQKLTNCQRWLEQFERYKYDIQAVLGQRQRLLIWGKPTRQGPVDLQELCLDDLQAVDLYWGQDTFPLQQLPDRLADKKQPPSLGLRLTCTTGLHTIPFTELSLAIDWGQWLDHQHQPPQHQEPSP